MYPLDYQPVENTLEDQIPAILAGNMPLTEQVQLTLNYQLYHYLDEGTIPGKELQGLLNCLLHAILHASASRDEQRSALLGMKDALVNRHVNIDTEVKILREGILKVDSGLVVLNEEEEGEVAQHMNRLEDFYTRFYPDETEARKAQQSK